jgi:hypothetical protein
VGDFNPDAGGHLVLWDFKLVVRFPAGSTVLIPSTLLLHSNTPIRSGEARYSIVQYAAGGLFRWAHGGFTSERNKLAEEGEEEMRRYRGERERSWARVAGMYTHLDELPLWGVVRVVPEPRSGRSRPSCNAAGGGEIGWH